MKQYKILALCIVMGLLNVAEVDAAVWYVHPDSMLNSIQAGLDSCSTGDTVLVAPSIYYEHINWPNTHSIVLTSESEPSTTIIDGDSISYISVININTGVDSTTIIDGFTIQCGIANMGGGIMCDHSSPTITNNIITHNGAWGGCGIYCDSSSAIIISNIIVDNIGGDGGGGIMCDNHSSVTITDNTISYNHIIAFVGGGIFCRYSSASITGNVITHNHSYFSGGGIECCICSVTITDNDISNNVCDLGCGGIYCGGGGVSSIIITDNTITYNSGDYSGGIECAISHPTSIINNTISNNTSANCGGGIRCNYASSPTILSNTITNNTALYGSGIYCYNASPLIQMCNISDNNGDGIYCESGSDPVINYNNIIDNTDYGVRNVDPSIIVDAEYNWWGDPSGPGGVGPGSGDEVSEYVDYEPWSTVPVDEVIISVPDTSYGVPSETIYIPIDTEELTGLGVVLAEFTLSYDSTIINGIGIDTSGTLLSGTDWSWNCNITPGQFSVTMTGTDTLISSGTLIKLVFVVLPDAEPGEESPLHFESFVFNEGIPIAITQDGVFIVSSSGIEENICTPISSPLFQCTPNPFSKLITITLKMIDDRWKMEDASLKIYDVSGRMVKDFNLKSEISNMQSTVSWNGVDDSNRKLSNGVYFCRLSVGDYQSTEKLLLVR